MCGRYTLSKLEQILRQFPGITALPPELAPRFNIAPTQPILAITNEHPNEVTHLYWGLVPSWAKDVSIGSKMINARAETVAEKATYRRPLSRRRCLILADGFYEWRKNPDKTKTPMYIRLKSGNLFAFAGLWEMWSSSDGSELPSGTVITTRPNALMADIHDRMPVILPPSAYKKWLTPEERSAEEFTGLLEPYPADDMEAYPVSSRVGSVKNNDRRLIDPVERDTLF
ncbi:SOS response-associated peptidase [Humisphaera borealis]|uniref:Abasic site processing protein n=1 Tax=Humisphaera borealis TaxID=2807512 RepID=A0A7M2X3K4_9BACT|nr:SOS response-associated peptidase [Humisphaera borealis]